MTYDVKDIAPILRELATEHPGPYLHPYKAGGNCVYFDQNGNPSCIVGNVLARLDPEIAKIVCEGEDTHIEERDDGEGRMFEVFITRACSWSAKSPRGYVAEARSFFTPAANDVLEMVQGQQDDEYSWSDAVDYALEGAS